jgi:hypothetical protein
MADNPLIGGAAGAVSVAQRVDHSYYRHDTIPYSQAK